MCCKCCGPTQRKVWLFGSAGSLIIFGVLMMVFWPDWSHDIVHSKLVLKPGSETYKMWVDTPVPIYLAIHMFNWTNPDQIRNKSEKPNFVEMGPYVFLEARKKEDVEFNDNNTVSFYGKRTWYFQPDKSNGSLDDLVTCPNLISMAVADMYRDQIKLKKMIINHMLNTEGGALAVTHTVGEWIFDGYEDPLVDLAERLNTTSLKIPTGKFGWMVNRNDSKTAEGRYTIRTGADDIHHMGDITRWNGKTNTGLFDGECGKINGSTGDLWSPELDVTQPLTLYAYDLCRFFILYPGPEVTKLGINGVKFWSTEMTFGNGDKYPNMDCFCPRGAAECPETGLYDASACKGDAPAYVTFPHFYMAEEKHRNAINGMNPDPEKHRFQISMEPTMGVPLEVTGAFQINLALKPDDVFDIYKDVPKILAPMFWLHEYGGLDEAMAKDIKLVLSLADIGFYIGVGLTSIGGLLLITGLGLTFTNKWGGEKKIV